MLHAIHIRPQKDFGTVDGLRQLTASDEIDLCDLVLFDVPLVVVIYDSKKRSVDGPFSLFLAETALFSHSRTGDTVRTYGEALVTWGQYLNAHSCSAENATERGFKQFRNRLASDLIAGGTKRRSSATVALKLRVISIFHEWAYQQEILDSPLGRWVADNNALARLVRGELGEGSTYRRRRSRLGIPVVTHRLPVSLPRDKIAALISMVEMPYSLAFKWAICTGIRRFELCELTVEQITEAREAINRLDMHGRISIRRKGDRALDLNVPSSLLDETWWYIQTERGKPIRSEINHVFLVKGLPISRSMLTQVYSKAASEVGCPSTLHHLRHTFAITAFHILSEKAAQGARINPLKVLQILLGHASMKTSEIYLRATQVQNDAVRDALNYLYGAT